MLAEKRARASRDDGTIRHRVVVSIDLQGKLRPHDEPRSEDCPKCLVDQCYTVGVQRVHWALLQDFTIKKDGPTAFEPAHIAHLVELRRSEAMSANGGPRRSNRRRRQHGSGHWQPRISD